MTPQALVDHFGGITAAARALGVKPPSVHEWVTKGEMPIGRQCQAEVVTSGVLRADRTELTIIEAPKSEAA